jgi:hypothetical protein
MTKNGMLIAIEMGTKAFISHRTSLKNRVGLRGHVRLTWSVPASGRYSRSADKRVFPSQLTDLKAGSLSQDEADFAPLFLTAASCSAAMFLWYSETGTWQ